VISVLKIFSFAGIGLVIGLGTITVIYLYHTVYYKEEEKPGDAQEERKKPVKVTIMSRSGEAV
jgi:hypothetical protein